MPRESVFAGIIGGRQVGDEHFGAHPARIRHVARGPGYLFQGETEPVHARFDLEGDAERAVPAAHGLVDQVQIFPSVCQGKQP